MATKEYTFTGETSAYVARREMLRSGFNVSLIAYDPSRNVYAFDVITED